jgi:hypothetical protein
VQVALTFLTADGKKMQTNWSGITLPAATAGSDAASWQMIKLSIADQLGTLEGGSAAVSLAWVSVQYVGAPSGGYYLTDCTIKKGE